MVRCPDYLPGDNRLRRTTMGGAVPIAASIFLDIFNVFLFMLQLLGGRPGLGNLQGGRWSVWSVLRYYSGLGSAPAEGLLCGAGILHAQSERCALLRLAEDVRGLDIDLALAQPSRGARERAGAVREAYLDDLPVA